MSEEKFENGGLPGVAEAITAMTGVQPEMVSWGDGIKAATFPMDQLKNALLGDETLDALVAAKRCSKNLGCGKSLVKEDGSPVYVFDTKGEAETYEMEFRRTGLCPTCLDNALDALDEREPGECCGESPCTCQGKPECNGMCLTAADIGIPASGIAYAHPDCLEHGDSA